MNKQRMTFAAAGVGPGRSPLPAASALAVEGVTAEIVDQATLVAKGVAVTVLVEGPLNHASAGGGQS
jgi:hypothetical protein